MTRFNDILNGIKQSLETEATKKIHKDENNNELKDTTKAGCGCSSPDSTNIYPENEYQEDRLSLLSEDEMKDETEKEEPKNEMEEGPEEEMKEYKQDFYEMSVGSIKSIMTHAYNILKALDNPAVKNNLTESWLQGKIAVTEDYMITIHNFVMFGPSETDTEGSEKKN